MSDFYLVKCADTEYSCLISKKCISKQLRCNEKFDCDLKEDELDCSKFIYIHY